MIPSKIESRLQRWFFFERSLTIQEKYLLLLIDNLAGKKGVIWYSNEKLAEVLGKDQRTVKRLLKKLEATEWIKRTFGQRIGKLQSGRGCAS